MCTPPPGQQWCLCRHDLEIARIAVHLLRLRLGMPPLLGPCDPAVIYINTEADHGAVAATAP